ncbi:2-alkenal reductase [candidate division KSB1 bacterium]|nr:MAG: 2-alkenal reductase [candidate division KSB1 bacterium]HDI51914.1 trypsin-like serine protease [Bacteroidota bacterium]
MRLQKKKVSPFGSGWSIICFLIVLITFEIQCTDRQQDHQLKTADFIGNLAVAQEPKETLPQHHANTDNNITTSRHNAITMAVAKVSPAVVGINVIQIREYVISPFGHDPFFSYFFPNQRYREKIKGLGSGFLISPDGYIVTNEHVVHNAVRVVATLETGGKYDAEIVGTDYVTDLALLKISGNNLPYCTLGNSDDIIIGEWVIALGNPFGLFEIGHQASVTVGVVSAVHLDFGRQGDDRVYQDMIQTDASINPGNSGGPMVNALGEVIGVNTFIFTGSETNRGSIGLSFAIPINRVKRVIEELKKYGKVSREFWTGLEIDDISPVMARFFGLKPNRLGKTRGVIVTNVEPNSPAEKAGFEIGDIILQINGRDIFNTQDVWDLLSDIDAKPGDVLKLKIFRRNTVKNIKLHLEKIG